MVSNIKKIGFAVLLTVFGVLSMSAQSTNPQIIAVVNKASWCHVCTANEPRVKKDLMPMLMQDPNVQVIVNDLSDKDTKAKSRHSLEEAGLTSFADENTGTGMIYFIDAESKKLISSTSLAESNENLMMAFEQAKTRKIPIKHGEKGHSCNPSCKSKM